MWVYHYSAYLQQPPCLPHSWGCLWGPRFLGVFPSFTLSFHLAAVPYVGSLGSGWAIRVELSLSEYCSFERPQRDVSPFLPCEDAARRQPSLNRERLSAPQSANSLTCSSQHPERWETNFYCLWAIYDILLSQLKQTKIVLFLAFYVILQFFKTMMCVIIYLILYLVIYLNFFLHFL